MRSRLMTFLGLLLLLVGPHLPGCGVPPPPSAKPAVVPTWQQEKVFFLGRIPYLNPSDVVASHKHFLDCLARALKVDRVSMVMAADYDGVIELLEAGRIDAAWLGTMAYVEARRKGRAILPVACPVRRGLKKYEGSIIARKGVVEKLSDLEGKTFAFVDPGSASGYLLPRRLLEKAGVAVPNDLLTRTPGTPDFLGKHDNVVMAVYLRRFAAGAVYKGAVERVFADSPEKAGELVELASTGLVPSEPIVVSSRGGAEAVSRLKEALLSLHFEGKEAERLDGVESFSAVSDADYAGVTKLVAP